MPLALVLLAVLQGAPLDADRDGLDDRLEAALLERFAPTLLLAPEDCAGLPAELEPCSAEPRVREQNATLYGQASPRPRLALPAAGPGAAAQAVVELHYYHLWDRDCGPAGHALDAEHVSSLVSAESADAQASLWRARYWYAAAHEDTPCDTSNAALAETLDAVERGPLVWISAGKHASYLDPRLCGERGCGVDRCAFASPLPARQVVNLGEPGRPLHGAIWVDAAGWSLAAKLGSDFRPALLARLERRDAAVHARVNDELRPLQLVIAAGGDSHAALATTDRHTSAALEQTERHTLRALGKSLRAVGRALDKVGP